jgi:hypothetical protein
MPVEIKECYSVKPHFNLRASVERLLADLPNKYTSGLATVVLRNSDSLNNDRRRKKNGRKGRKSARGSAGGYIMRHGRVSRHG